MIIEQQEENIFLTFKRKMDYINGIDHIYIPFPQETNTGFVIT
ncbi:Protein of unknown function [Bacillus wiedmannii]|uniref:Uncharacterized protein n=1 Tax=Bacillus wiedmannii TaxID=1890302 RepID=A0AB37Z245_9BACI|nr:Protein of unknown function [Bacillus wiedmannii]